MLSKNHLIFLKSIYSLKISQIISHSLKKINKQNGNTKIILSDHMWLSKFFHIRIGLHKLYKFKPNFASMFKNNQELK